MLAFFFIKNVFTQYSQREKINYFIDTDKIIKINKKFSYFEKPNKETFEESNFFGIVEMKNGFFFNDYYDFAIYV